MVRVSKKRVEKLPAKATFELGSGNKEKARGGQR